MKKIRIGVFGGRRGGVAMRFCREFPDAELVAVCDGDARVLERRRAEYPDKCIGFYSDFDAFLQHPMDAVVLANYATEHAPYAIRAMRAGLDVLSECLPCQTPKEAVELIEAVEQTGRKYCYLENFCYSPATSEMRRLFRAGKLGEFRYGEGEYIHNMETLAPDITYGQRDHWRNHISALFYSSHSVGPLLHISGLRPVEVTGFELPRTALQERVGSMAGGGGILMVRLENGALVKSIQGYLYRNSEWFCAYGSKGRAESAREDADNGGVSRLYLNADTYEGEYAPEPVLSYRPTRPRHWDSNGYAHGRGDWYCLFHAIEYLRGNQKADILDVYEAVDIALTGQFGYFSVLDGGKPKKIPDFRKKRVRDKYRNDTRCTDPKVAGEQLLPSYSKGEREIPDEVYRAIRAKYQEDQIDHGVL